MPQLFPGDPAPWFTAPASNNPEFHFSSAAGRVIVLSFFGSAAIPQSAKLLDLIEAGRAVFDDDEAAFFGVTVDPEDLNQKRLRPQPRGIRFFYDFEQKVSRLYGALEGAPTDPPSQAINLRTVTYVLDPQLRVLRVLPMTDPEQHVAELVAYLRALPRIGPAFPSRPQAPVLVLPRVFEPAFCRQLIKLYETNGGEDSGFMREKDGVTVRVLDHNHKKRSDYVIDSPEVQGAARARILRRLVPEIEKAFQFKATRMERYIVACYDGTTGGHFRAHRDNTTKGTAHRRFAVTINLNAEEYEGGNLRFPEFGPAHYRATTGGAVVFSCSLLHEATPVRTGTRYAFLPFLYDEAAAALREQNNRFLEKEIGEYKR